MNIADEGGAASVKVLVQLLKDEKDPETRRIAVFALGQTKSDEAVAVLLDLVKTDKDPEGPDGGRPGPRRDRDAQGQGGPGRDPEQERELTMFGRKARLDRFPLILAAALGGHELPREVVRHPGPESR